MKSATTPLPTFPSLSPREPWGGFGWQFDFDTAANTVPQPEDSELVRDLPLGTFSQQNASYGHEASGVYFIASGNYRSGTKSAPVLYQVMEVHHTNLESEVIQRNVYEPHELDCATVQSGDCDAPVETTWESSMRVHRHWLESLDISGEDAADITPWVTIPDVAIWPDNYTTTADDITRQLCMLRAKNIAELLVWTNTVTPQVDWPAFINIYKRVYAPVLDDVTLIDGTVATGSAVAVERVRRTLFDGDLPVVIALDSETVGLNEVTSLDVHFDNMTAHSGETLRIVLESSVSTTEEIGTPVVPPIYGQLYVWDGDLENWIAVDCPDHDDVSSIPAGDFGYFTPDYTGRRVFEIKDCRVREIGESTNQITIRIVHTSEYTFTASHDLVQVLWTGSYGDCYCNIECEDQEDPENPMRGADMDYNRTVDSTDTAAFDAAYIRESPAADMNRDGIIDEDDLSIFAELFGG